MELDTGRYPTPECQYCVYWCLPGMALPSIAMTGLATVVDAVRLPLKDMQRSVVAILKVFKHIWINKSPFLSEVSFMANCNRCLTRFHIIYIFFCNFHTMCQHRSILHLEIVCCGISARVLAFSSNNLDMYLEASSASSRLPSTVYIVSASIWSSMPDMFVNGGRIISTASSKKNDN